MLHYNHRDFGIGGWGASSAGPTQQWQQGAFCCSLVPLIYVWWQGVLLPVRSTGKSYRRHRGPHASYKQGLNSVLAMLESGPRRGASAPRGRDAPFNGGRADSATRRWFDVKHQITIATRLWRYERTQVIDVCLQPFWDIFSQLLGFTLSYSTVVDYCGANTGSSCSSMRRCHGED
jgi:hypothetical protein